MTEIRNFFTNLFNAHPSAGGRVAPAPFTPSAPSANKGEGAGEPAPADRTIHDTVTLSEGGHKIVNLARGGELAKQIRTAPVDKDFAANLLKAQEDIFRINLLFSETIKALFLELRK